MKRILHDHGIDPAPERSRRLPWKTFLQAPWEGLTACDLFTVEVLTLAGLQRYLVFFVIALQSRRVTIAGIHPQPYGTWMEQMARNLTDPVDGCLRRARYLIHDRDPLYTRGFGEILKGGGVQPIRLPPKSPNLPSDTPARIRQLIQTCLQKDPKRRVHDVADVRLAMEGAFETTVSQPSLAVTALNLQIWQRPVPLTVAAVGLMAITGLAVWSASRPEPIAALDLMQFVISPPQSAPLNLRQTRQDLAISQTAHASSTRGPPPRARQHN